MSKVANAIPVLQISVDVIVNNVFGRYVIDLDLADPNFADFTSNIAKIMYFGLAPLLGLGSIKEHT